MFRPVKIIQKTRPQSINLGSYSEDSQILNKLFLLILIKTRAFSTIKIESDTEFDAYLPVSPQLCFSEVYLKLLRIIRRCNCTACQNQPTTY